MSGIRRTREERLAVLDASLGVMRTKARAKIEAKRHQKYLQTQRRMHRNRQRRKKKAIQAAIKAKWYADRQRGYERRLAKALKERLTPFAKTFATTTDTLKMIFERLPRAVVEMLIEKQLLTEDQREQAIASAQRALPTYGLHPVPPRKQFRRNS